MNKNMKISLFIFLYYMAEAFHKNLTFFFLINSLCSSLLVFTNILHIPRDLKSNLVLLFLFLSSLYFLFLYSCFSSLTPVQIFLPPLYSSLQNLSHIYFFTNSFYSSLLVFTNILYIPRDLKSNLVLLFLFLSSLYFL